MKNTRIEWTDHTFNPWMGCSKVSAGCANCYAERDMDHRWGKVRWGPGQPRKRTSASNWQQPKLWARAARDAWAKWEREGRVGPPPARPRVFCASLADWLDAEVPDEWRADLLDLIAATPELDWLLLTKRPERWQGELEAAIESRPGRSPGDAMADRWLCGKPPEHVWLGTSVEHQEAADTRVPLLLAIPARVRFLSMEPLLGPVDLGRHIRGSMVPGDEAVCGLDWIIVGGESGPGARPMHPEWARSLRDQAKAVGVPVFFKQWGEWARASAPPEEDDAAVDLHPSGMTPDGRISTYTLMRRLGKAAAGRMLDGRTWDEVPR